MEAPKTAQQWYEFLGALPSQEAARIVHTYRERARNDVLFLAKEILGFDWVEYDLPYHIFLAKQAMHLGDSLTLTPRSFIKSTIITIAGTIQYILRFPEHSVLILSNKEKNAQKFLRAITTHFSREDSVLRVFFPLYCPYSRKEDPTSMEFTVPNRHKSRPEASVEVSGILGSMAGRHYERIVSDDIVHEINVPPKGSPEVMMSVWEGFKATDSLTKGGISDGHASHRTTVGTRWHDGDTYGLILSGGDDADIETTRLYNILIAEPYGNLWYSPEGEVYDYHASPILSSDNGVLWPSRYPRWLLNQMRKRRGEYHWACNMAQDPLPPKTAVSFQDKWFKPFKVSEVDMQQFNLAITVDGAYNEASTTSDRSAIVLSGVPASGAIWWFASRAGKFTPHQIATEIISMWKTWPGVLWVGIECDGGGKVIYNAVKDIIEHKGIDIVLKQLWTQGMRKDARVALLQARAQRHGLYYNSEIDDLHVKEVLRFPVGRWRDIPDALAYRAIKLNKPSVVVPREKEVWTPPPPIAHKGSDLIKQYNGVSSDTISVRRL